MGMKAIHSWTLAGLILAFVDLAVAYCLLCASAFAFLPSKVLSFFELYMPCPCTGFFGYQNSNLCFHELLIEWPTSKISYVLELVRSRFPFDLIWPRGQSCNLHGEGIRDRRCENGTFEMEGEACSSLSSAQRMDDCSDDQSRYEAKGKKIMNQKQKSGIRRRRRASLGYGKFSSAAYSSERSSIAIGVSHHPYNDREITSETSESLDPIRQLEYGLLDDRNAPNAPKCGERTWSRFELSGSNRKDEGINKDSSTIENLTHTSEHSMDIVGNDAKAIKMLTHALEEERAARSLLYQELEKERAAAASAADEAMAMIFRLQEDKASIEMEVRQYQRMIDEKFAYDEEEMNILKEILVRRERENHFLEKELEAYREAEFSGSEELDCDMNSEINNSQQRPIHSVAPNANLPQMSQHIQNSKFLDENEVSTTTNILPNYALGEGIVSSHKELPSDLAISHGHKEQNNSNIAQTDTSARDISMISPGMVAPKAQGANREGLGNNENLCNEGFHSSLFETEPTVYDVHVIDDKTIVWKEDDIKKSRPLRSGASDSGFWSGNELSDCPSTSMIEIKPNSQRSHLDTSSQLSDSDNSHCKTLPRRNSSSALNSERLKIDAEVEWLRERLRIVQEGKEKLAFSAENRDKVKAQLKLVEEIVNQLQGIQLLREPLRQGSLPPLPSKVTWKKRHCRSASCETFDTS